MKLSDLIDEIMGDLNFNELEIRENNAGCDFKGTLDECKNKIGLRLISSKSKGLKCYEFGNDLGFYKISHGLGDKLYITMYKIMNGAQLKDFKYLRNGKIKSIR